MLENFLPESVFRPAISLFYCLRNCPILNVFLVNGGEVLVDEEGEAPASARHRVQLQVDRLHLAEPEGWDHFLFQFDLKGR